MVLPADDLDEDPTDHAVAGPIYRMTGRFDGRQMTGTDWVEARGSEPPNFPEAKGPLQAY